MDAVYGSVDIFLSVFKNASQEKPTIFFTNGYGEILKTKDLLGKNLFF